MDKIKICIKAYDRLMENVGFNFRTGSLSLRILCPECPNGYRTAMYFSRTDLNDNPIIVCPKCKKEFLVVLKNKSPN